MRLRKSSPFPQRTEEISFESSMAMLGCCGVGFCKSTPKQTGKLKWGGLLKLPMGFFAGVWSKLLPCVFLSVLSRISIHKYHSWTRTVLFGCIYNTSWHGIKRGSLEVDLTGCATVLGLFNPHNIYQRWGLYQLQVTGMTKQCTNCWKTFCSQHKLVTIRRSPTWLQPWSTKKETTLSTLLVCIRDYCKSTTIDAR